MRITPLEIRQKTFEKNFRGYEKEEVNAFLLTLSQEWERMMDENKELRIKLEATEREVTKLREVETSLYKTLKTAEDTGANVIEQARTAADLHLRESQLKADAVLQEAKSKAKDTIDESEMRAKQIIADMEDRVKALIDNYKKMESSREDLLGELKRLATDTIDRVERARNLTKEFDPDKHLANVRREAKKVVFPNLDFEKHQPEMQEVEGTTTATGKEEIELEPQPVLSSAQPKKVQKSFFDEIG
ncbi:MAG: DivIVA domain-containing protein [Bacteroidota bacterium]